MLLNSLIMSVRELWGWALNLWYFSFKGFFWLILLFRFVYINKSVIATVIDNQTKNYFNPLSPNIHIQILQTDLNKFPYRIS